MIVGTSSSGAGLQTVTGNTKPARIVSGGDMFIQLNADSSTNGRGFKATISLVGKLHFFNLEWPLLFGIP